MKEHKHIIKFSSWHDNEQIIIAWGCEECYGALILNYPIQITDSAAISIDDLQKAIDYALNSADVIEYDLPSCREQRKKHIKNPIPLPFETAKYIDKLY